LPESDDDERAVTVRRLLSQNSGLPLGPVGEDAEYPPSGDVPPLRTYLSREARLSRPPGSGFAYSNVGFNLLELLVEEGTGRDFAAYMATEVLRPLGMRQSSYAWADSLRPRMPTGYERGGTPVPPYVYPAAASGGLLGTAGDVARFVAASVADTAVGTPPVLSPERIRTLHTPQVEIPGLYGMVADAYGFGHFLETLPTGQTAVWHGGQGHGWMTHFHAVPASGDGLVILTNSERSWPVMARILSDWAQWSGIGAVKMGRITQAATVLQILVGLMVLATLWGAGRLLWGLRRGTRRWAPLSGPVRPTRLLRAGLGLGIIAALAWSIAQPYLMVTAIFPATAEWAGLALLGGAGVLLLSASVPRVAA
jgi:CubicO group peptidase (beta-lactamase class C family)